MDNLQDVGNLDPHGPLQPINVQEGQNEHVNKRQPGSSNIIYMADDRDRTIRRLRREQRNPKTVTDMNNLQDEGNLNPH